MTDVRSDVLVLRPLVGGHDHGRLCAALSRGLRLVRNARTTAGLRGRCPEVAAILRGMRRWVIEPFVDVAEPCTGCSVPPPGSLHWDLRLLDEELSECLALARRSAITARSRRLLERRLVVVDLVSSALIARLEGGAL